MDRVDQDSVVFLLFHHWVGFLHFRAFQLLDDIKLCDAQESKECISVIQFLRMVDYQLLLRQPNLQKVADYLDSSPQVASKLPLETFNKLCGAFSACHLWSSLLSLVHSCQRPIPMMRTTICEPFESVVKHLGVSEKVVSVFEWLTEEQKAGLTNQVPLIL